jgi:Domain of unknown function (DUF4145)
MPPKQVIPALALDSYSCPHCGALSHQHWFRTFVAGFERGKKPAVFHLANFQRVDKRQLEDDERKRIAAFENRMQKNEVTYEVLRYGVDCLWQFANLHMSLCHSCEGWAVWIKDGIAWPVQEYGIEPHEDMPANVKADFEEAAAIVDRSPRGAAALVRLALQKLMVDLGETGKNLNDDIASLVEKGLEASIQKALDVVRVIGNNAVHPGEIDLKDDKATATALLNLVNIIVDRRIAATKRIDEMFKNLPPGALEAIAKRDKAD